MIGPAFRLGLATVLLFLVLVQPNHPAAMTWGALRVFPLELPVILAALILLGGGVAGRWLRIALVALIALLSILKAADYAMFTSLGRGFNPVADFPLIDAGVRLMLGAVGSALTVLAVLAALTAAVALVAALWWATGVWARVQLSGLRGGAVALVAVVFAAVATAEVGGAMGRWSLPAPIPGAAFTARIGIERTVQARATIAELQSFRQRAATDAFASRPGLLSAIDRDVLIVFVESYGRTSLDTPLYAPTHRATLARMEEKLAGQGLSMRSGFLEAPTRGGQSWLSHASFAGGFWIDNQTSYRAALVSGRRTLFHIAAEHGFHTAAVMPQITMDWPESSVMGFETILASDDLGYRGKPFNWVTMPDQFTFAAMDRLLRDGQSDRPMFIQMALGSSHAPWVPVPDLVEWDAVGDGTIFNAMAEAGDPPKVVWRDRDRVRDQYRQAVDYALNVVFDYIARHAENPPLVFVIGDHQAASFVALDDRPDVPIHVVGPADLVARTAAWGWTPGLLPDSTIVPRRMDGMRDLILEAFSEAQLVENGL